MGSMYIYRDAVFTLDFVQLTLHYNKYSGEKQANHRKSVYELHLPCHDNKWELPETAYHASVQVQQLQEKLSNAARSSSCSTSPLLHKQLAQLLQERDAILAHNHQLTGQPVTSASQHLMPLTNTCWVDR